MNWSVGIRRRAEIRGDSLAAPESAGSSKVREHITLEFAADAEECRPTPLAHLRQTALTAVRVWSQTSQWPVGPPACCYQRLHSRAARLRSYHR